MQYKNRSTLWLFGRTLLPSMGSIAGSMVVILLIVGFHLLLLSNNADLFLPYVAGRSDDQLAEIYESNILGPLNNIFGSGLLGAVSTAFVWGLIGLIIYTLFDFLIASLQEWRRSDSDIAMSEQGKIIRHPLHNQAVIRILWRFLLGVIAIAGIIALRPMILNLFAHDVAFLKAASAVEMLKHLGVVIAGWLLILHLYVVLFRLFMFRTRVFGEIIY
jgi:hypothetical protein